MNGAGRLVLTADPSRCLLLYPLAAWEPIQARLMALSSFNEKIRSLQRLLVGYADDVDIDTAGRILVPPSLRRYANLDKHVVLVGQGHKFELWDESAVAGANRADHRLPRRRPAARTRRLHALGRTWPMESMSPSCSKKPWRRWRSGRPVSTSTQRSAAAAMRGRFSRAWRPRDASSASTAIPPLKPPPLQLASHRFPLRFPPRLVFGTARRPCRTCACAGRRRAARSRNLLAADRRREARLFLPPRRSARHADGPVARRIRCRIPCPRHGARTDGGLARLW